MELLIESMEKILGCRDPRYKHEYLDKYDNLNDLTERCEDDDDQSDRHLEARDRRYSCLT